LVPYIANVPSILLGKCISPGGDGVRGVDLLLIVLAEMDEPEQLGSILIVVEVNMVVGTEEIAVDAALDFLLE
jgi:hypothetical protein